MQTSVSCTCWSISSVATNMPPAKSSKTCRDRGFILADFTLMINCVFCRGEKLNGTQESTSEGVFFAFSWSLSCHNMKCLPYHIWHLLPTRDIWTGSSWDVFVPGPDGWHSRYRSSGLWSLYFQCRQPSLHFNPAHWWWFLILNGEERQCNPLQSWFKTKLHNL